MCHASTRVQAIASLLAAVLSSPGAARADIAITEVMSSAAQTWNGTKVEALSDFFEVTNFGPIPVDLTGYAWRDGKGGLLIADPEPFGGIVIASGESIVFVENDPAKISKKSEFREWWGTALPATTRIVLYNAENRGLSSQGESVRIWSPTARDDSDLAARANFGPAMRGRTFTYDSVTGEFGVYSVEGVNGAFRAGTRDDIGSPGVNTGPVAARIITGPTTITNCAQTPAVFSVRAGGMPLPRLQWFANNTALIGAVMPTLIITNPMAFAGAQFQVRATNVLGAVWSTAVTLHVLTNQAAPVFVSAPVNAALFAGDTARFTADICSWPPARLQWSRNGIPLPGETNRDLTIQEVQLADSAARFCVEARNDFGTNSACAVLTVTHKPLLRITEVFAGGREDCVRDDALEDWFEITNFDTFAVDLRGYRVGNFVEDLASGSVYAIPRSVIVAPGRSAIFIREHGAEDVVAAFRNWWGHEALPPDLQLSTFAGFSLNHDSDSLFLWTPSEGDVDEFVDGVQYAGGERGLSKWFDPAVWPIQSSVIGERGAFESRDCAEVASPGYIDNPAARFTSITFNDTHVNLRWRAVHGRTYRIEAASDPASVSWSVILDRTAANAIELFSEPASENMRFYRVQEVTP